MPLVSRASNTGIAPMPSTTASGRLREEIDVVAWNPFPSRVIELY
jgi:hypothetical protein